MLYESPIKGVNGKYRLRIGGLACERYSYKTVVYYLLELASLEKCNISQVSKAPDARASRIEKKENIVNTTRNVSEGILDPPDGAICQLCSIVVIPSVPCGTEEPPSLALPDSQPTDLCDINKPVAVFNH